MPFHFLKRMILMMLISLSFLFGVAFAAISPEEFHTPPLSARPSVLWTWMNGHVDRPQITRELEELKDKGLRGAIIWDLGSLTDPDKIIPAGPQFMGEESLRSIHYAMDEAQRLGLELGLVAASSWNSGGTWIEPKHACKALIWSELALEGPQEFSGLLPKPAKITAHHETLSVMAVPAVSSGKSIRPSSAIHLDEKVDAKGQLTWSVPPGKWRVLQFVVNNTGEFLNCPSPNSRGLVIDHLSAAATTRHLNHMMDALLRGRDGFGAMKSLMLDSYEVRPGWDWTPDFLQKFQQRYGYDAVPWLPVIAGVDVGEKQLSQRFLHDYRKLVSDLMIEDHYALSRRLLNERGLTLLAEAGHGGYARVDPLKALGAADIPMGEFWNHRKNWVTKEAASAAHIYGKNIVNSESFTGWQHWQDGPAAYKRLFDIALCAGLNQVTFHTFAHNPPSAGLPGYAYHAGEHFNVNLTWWHHAAPMIEDMSRACYLMQQGRFVADVAAYYGDDAPNLVPARRLPPTIDPPYKAGTCQHCGKDMPVNLSSLGQGYDYDYVNEEVILQRMSVQDSRLVLPDGMSYRLLVLPDRKSISLEALKRIGELVDAGATVVGAKPERSNSLRGYPQCDEEVKNLAAVIWGNCDGKVVKSIRYGKGRVCWNVSLRELLSEMNVEADFIPLEIDNSDQHIDYIHRETEDEDIYFVSNSSLQQEIVRCRFRVKGDRVPSFWNAETGEITACHEWAREGNFTTVKVNLPPASSIFVVFAEGAARESIVGIEREAASGNETHRSDIQILEISQTGGKAMAWSQGSYRLLASSGKTATMRVKEMPSVIEFVKPWRVSFPANRGAPPELTMNLLVDWTKHADPGVRFFSGTATYLNQFHCDASSTMFDPLWLDLGDVRDVAVVRVNGKQAGILWKAPYRVDISSLVKAGENHVEIDVTNQWNNRIVGDQQPGVEQRITKTNLVTKFHATSPLLPSGLLGPVLIQRATLVDWQWQ